MDLPNTIESEQLAHFIEDFAHNLESNLKNTTLLFNSILITANLPVGYVVVHPLHRILPIEVALLLAR